MSEDQTILLVDDDEIFLGVLAKALRGRGFEALTATGSAGAVRLAQARQPAMAVVDLKLEGESGLDLIPELVATRPGMNIVVLTGYSSIATAVTAIKRGATEYLSKPVTADEVIRALAGKARAREELEDFSPMSIERLEWEHIQKVLKENDGNISATARSLGMHRRTLQRKLAKKPVPE
ncbi:MAG: response regulator transcription factor [Lysobacterales bacterium]|jgi:two-component system response regulator RegA